ncbi:unnamed protein product [Periconia digitata]|uniref:Wax synthase domain-containing protein n=1 Tax=Periconia digitata TaxID=1303443 RepID=A0A9W4XJP8_9PLEO|nr:unnamed protein product [Periconia digitata]
MQNDRYQANLTLREPTGSIVPHVALYAIQFVALASPSFKYRRLFFSSIIIALAIQAHLNPHFTNNVALAQPFTIAWSYYMATLAKLLFSANGPEAQYWRIDRPAAEARSFVGFGWRKLVWASMVVFNQRGVRWNHQVKNVPLIPQGQSKTKFLFWQAWQFVKCMMIADLLFELTRRWMFMLPDGSVGTVNSKYLSLQHPDWRWSFAKAFVFGSTPYFMLSMQYAQFAFVAVLLGLSKPEDWPSPFGKLSHATTVRDFWGSYWHQQLRHMLTQYSDAVATFFRIRKGTNMSSYTKLYTAFLISGTFHALSQLQMPSPINITAEERTRGFFLFFVWQMAAITLEDFVQWIVRTTRVPIFRGEGTWISTVVGWAWVTVVMWKGLPLVGDTFVRMRMGVDPLLPNSFSRGFVERWVPIPPPSFERM